MVRIQKKWRKIAFFYEDTHQKIQNVLRLPRILKYYSLRTFWIVIKMISFFVRNGTAISIRYKNTAACLFLARSHVCTFALQQTTLCGHAWVAWRNNHVVVYICLHNSAVHGNEGSFLAVSQVSAAAAGRRGLIHDVTKISVLRHLRRKAANTFHARRKAANRANLVTIHTRANWLGQFHYSIFVIYQ